MKTSNKYSYLKILRTIIEIKDTQTDKKYMHPSLMHVWMVMEMVLIVFKTLKESQLKWAYRGMLSKQK
jgi:hypothetical protein